MIGWKQKSSWFIVTYLSALTLSSCFARRWRTNDAIVQDVWPETDSIKFKRASADSSAIGTAKVQEDIPPIDLDEEESTLIFEGRYFKPNEVPPPPPFMVANGNWRGGIGNVQSAKIKQDQQQQKPKISGSGSSSFQFVVGTESKTPPSPLKFTEENAKDSENKNSKNETTEERISSSNSKNVIASSPIQFMEDIHFQEEHEQGNDDVTEEAFQNAPKCFTATDTPGRCVSFRQCYPVVFNVIDGDLRNPGLAKLLYQSSGPCNATLELEFALSKLKSDKTYINAKFYNQSICCPGFKHPATILRSWENDPRKTRLTSSDTNKTPSLSISQPPISISSRQSSSTIKSYSTETKNAKPITKEEDSLDSGLTLIENKSRPVGIDESSVEISQAEFPANRDGSEESDGSQSTAQDYLSILGGEDDSAGDDEVEEEKFIQGPEFVKENSTLSKASNVEDNDHDEDDSFSMEERRGNRDKESIFVSSGGNKAPSDAFLSVPAPHLAPNKCRHQVYGMPRGHWPWMVALVISSRHICSGALIDERHVITAAHCVHLLSETDVKKLRIIIGDRVMYSAVDGPHFWRKASRITTHVNYNQQTFAGDIAIIKMNSDIPFTRNIQPISLSDLVSPVDSSTFGRGIVAGWSGADIGQPSFEARTEQETVVEIMDKAECRERYRGFALSGVATNTFCSKPANNTCVADSGAPLIVRVQNCWVLAGIMSWGLGCSHFPEVYTDVSRYSLWIRKHVV